MSKSQKISASEVVHQLQLEFFDGIQNESQHFAARSWMSKSDYQDVVTERSLCQICGYPLCSNALPTERSRKGHYRISLKEHKVYDLHETYMYCSSTCLVNSRAFASSLHDERGVGTNLPELNEISRRFRNLGLECEENVDESGDSGDSSKLRIQEKSEVKGGEVPIQDWIGPSNAIEGYVPKQDYNSLPSSSKKGSELGSASLSEQNDTVQKVDLKVDAVLNEDKTLPRRVTANEIDSRTNKSISSKHWVNEMDFSSVIITNDEYVSQKVDGDSKPKGSKQKKSRAKKGKDSIFGDMDFMSTIISQDEYNISKPISSEVISETSQMTGEFAEKLGLQNVEKQAISGEASSGFADTNLQYSTNSAVTRTGTKKNESSGISKASLHGLDDANPSTSHSEDNSCIEQAVQSCQTTAKSSMKTSKGKKATRTVTWADEKNNVHAGGNLCEFREIKNTKVCRRNTVSKVVGDNDDPRRFTSAEACAMALTQVAEAVASGQSDVVDAASEAGIIVLPQPLQPDEGEDMTEEADALKELASPKWPSKQENLDSDFDSNDSWFETPPKEFSLNLSSFATMWNALFSWITSSSLAYIYGRDESSHVEYLSVNGREYLGKVVLDDGRSSEIKVTLAACLGRALPEVAAALELPTPISTLESALGCLVNTMSLMDALPPFTLKQWQVIVTLLVDALSVCRIPGLTPYFTNRRILISKVLDGARITMEEYELMKDVLIPLGRVPQFSMQSGG